MTNRHRGEVSLSLADRELPMRLTLQSLAEIEAAMGGDLAEIGTRFATGRIKALDIVALLGAALRGGGSQLTNGDIAAMLPAEDLPQIVESLSDLFALTFGTKDRVARQPAENPTLPQNV
jgi:Phage tail tube protein, GTA-gp10